MPNIKRGMMGAAGVVGGAKTYVWGSNSNGVFGDGTETTTSSPVLTTELGFAKIVGGNSVFTARKTDGTIWTCGRGNFGMPGHGNATSIC